LFYNTATFILALSAPSVLASDLTGYARVIDGNALQRRGTRIRLWRIDAPEITELRRRDRGGIGVSSPLSLP
jgi:endonuclease YncB( thermonuclease family)